MPPAAARRRVELYSRLEVVSLGLTDLLGAIDITRLHSVSLWDALILRAAHNAGCEVVYTEDLQPGFRLEGLEVVNPFATP
jgi:predicted nucleic acid-binding protein